MSISKIYDPSGVGKEFERRMRAEKITAMKFLLASHAAAAGSEEAALFFLESAKDTDYVAVRNLHYTLAITYGNYSGGPPAWQRTDPPELLVELSLAILSDQRQVTGMEKTNFLGGTSFRIFSASHETSHLVSALEEMKCRKAVPLLVDRVKAKNADWYTLHALGAMGDLRAAPVLIEQSPVLHDRDRSHPTPAGAYLAACVFLTVLLKVNPVGIKAGPLPGETRAEGTPSRRLETVREPPVWT